MSLNIANIPSFACRDNAQQPAIYQGSRVITYQQFNQDIAALYFALQQHGIKKGDKIALLLPNVPQFSISYYAVLSLGAVVVPLNVLLTAEEIRYHINDSDCVAIIAAQPFLNQVQTAIKQSKCQLVIACRLAGDSREIPQPILDYDRLLRLSKENPQVGGMDVVACAADDTAVILYTSGTTGRPKGAELTHFNLYENARWVSERLMRREYNTLTVFGPGHVALAALPLFHSFGQTVIQNAFFMHGAAISLLAKFTPKDAALSIRNHNVTFFAGVPTMFITMLMDENVNSENLQTLKFAISGGAPLPIEILKQYKDRFGINILEGYGLSETSPVACFNNLMRPQKPGTVGPAIDNCEVKIVDAEDKEVAIGESGEVIIRGTNVMKQYFKQPEATQAVIKNGWFYSGDIGKLDSEGFLTIVDRKKDMIINNGMNVYPREVEEVIYQLECVAEVAVVGVPHDIHGESVVAVVTIKSGYEYSEDTLIQHCKKCLASFKIPKKTLVVDSLPKGPTGKILKREIKNLYLRPEKLSTIVEI